MPLLSLLLIQRLDINNNAIYDAVPHGATTCVHSLFYKGSLFKDWLTYYGDQNENLRYISFKERKEKIDTIQSTAALNVYVSHCGFSDITGATQGGCISYEAKASSRMLVELSSFLSCSATTYGGAVYIRYGECILTKLCAVKCVCTSSVSGLGQLIFTSLTVNKNNNVYDSPIALCGSESVYARTISIGGGIVQIMRVNFTGNQCVYEPTIYCPITSSTADITCSMQYCNAQNNTANICRVI